MAETLVLDLILLGLALIVAIACVMMRNLLASVAMLAIYSLLMSLVWTNMYALDVAFTEAAVGAGISTILMIGALVITGTREKVKHTIHWPALILVVLVGLVLAYGSLQLPAFGDPDAPIHNYVYDGYINQDVGKPRPNPMRQPGEWDQHPADPEQWRRKKKVQARMAAVHESLEREARETGEMIGRPPKLRSDEDRERERREHVHHGDFSHHSPNMVTAVLASYRGFDTMFETAVIFTAGISVILLLRRRETVLPAGKELGKATAGDKPKSDSEPEVRS